MPRVAVLDTETTGLYPGTDRIIELAVVLLDVELDTGRPQLELDRYEALQDPHCPIPYEAYAVHGITQAMVRGQAIDAPRVLDLLRQADLLVAHNSGFDRPFVGQVVPEALDMTWGCSCRGIPWKRLFPVRSTSLQSLAQTLGLPKGRAHRAMGDVETTLALLATELPDQERCALGHLLASKLQPKTKRSTTPRTHP